MLYLLSHSLCLHEHVSNHGLMIFSDFHVYEYSALSTLPYTYTLWVLHSKFENMIITCMLKYIVKDFLTQNVGPVNMALKERKT